METDNIYNQDCLIGMKEIPDESIDLVATDCPYRIVGGGSGNSDHEPSGILNKQREYITKDGVVFKKGTKHINLCGVFDDRVGDVRAGKLFTHNDIAFSEWLPDVYRVLKQGTHCYIMVNARNLKELQTEAEKVGFVFQNLLVWDKKNATPNKYYMQCLEFILMLSKRPARNINDMGCKNLLPTPNIIGNKPHPTEKPVALMEQLIRQRTDEGDIVLDPFAGGGSTLIAAKRLKRHYIGFEIDKQYYDIACNRLYKEPQQTAMFA